MAQRSEAVDSLDFFPTPPWATRALLEHVIPDAHGIAWEPACGERHMADVLLERFDIVHCSDVYRYGASQEVGSFVGHGPDVAKVPGHVDWVITNPPFNLAVEFAERALAVASHGVAFLVRTAWLESVNRYERLFRDSPPEIIAPFVERVPMVKGRWDPNASTATAYAWFVWRRTDRLLPGQIGLTSWNTGGASLVWIPPDCRRRLTHPDDVRRFAMTGETTT
jgi:hypothetical protein